MQVQPYESAHWACLDASGGDLQPGVHAALVLVIARGPEWSAERFGLAICQIYSGQEVP